MPDTKIYFGRVVEILDPLLKSIEEDIDISSLAGQDNPSKRVLNINGNSNYCAFIKTPPLFTWEWLEEGLDERLAKNKDIFYGIEIFNIDEKGNEKETLYLEWDIPNTKQSNNFFSPFKNTRYYNKKINGFLNLDNIAINITNTNNKNCFNVTKLDASNIKIESTDKIIDTIFNRKIFIFHLNNEIRDRDLKSIYKTENLKSKDEVYNVIFSKNYRDNKWMMWGMNKDSKVWIAKQKYKTDSFPLIISNNYEEWLFSPKYAKKHYNFYEYPSQSNPFVKLNPDDKKLLTIKLKFINAVPTSKSEPECRLDYSKYGIPDEDNSIPFDNIKEYGNRFKNTLFNLKGIQFKNNLNQFVINETDTENGTKYESVYRLRLKARIHSYRKSSDLPVENFKSKYIANKEGAKYNSYERILSEQVKRTYIEPKIINYISDQIKFNIDEEFDKLSYNEIKSVITNRKIASKETAKRLRIFLEIEECLSDILMFRGDLSKINPKYISNDLKSYRKKLEELNEQYYSMDEKDPRVIDSIRYKPVIKENAKIDEYFVNTYREYVNHKDYSVILDNYTSYGDLNLYQNESMLIYNIPVDLDCGVFKEMIGCNQDNIKTIIIDIKENELKFYKNFNILEEFIKKIDENLNNDRNLKYLVDLSSKSSKKIYFTDGNNGKPFINSIIKDSMLNIINSKNSKNTTAPRELLNQIKSNLEKIGITIFDKESPYLDATKKKDINNKIITSLYNTPKFITGNSNTPKCFKLEDSNLRIDEDGNRRNIKPIFSLKLDDNNDLDMKKENGILLLETHIKSTNINNKQIINKLKIIKCKYRNYSKQKNLEAQYNGEISALHRIKKILDKGEQEGSYTSGTKILNIMKEGNLLGLGKKINFKEYFQLVTALLKLISKVRHLELYYDPSSNADLFSELSPGLCPSYENTPSYNIENPPGYTEQQKIIEDELNFLKKHSQMVNKKIEDIDLKNLDISIFPNPSDSCDSPSDGICHNLVSTKFKEYIKDIFEEKGNSLYFITKQKYHDELEEYIKKKLLYINNKINYIEKEKKKLTIYISQLETDLKYRIAEVKKLKGNITFEDDDDIDINNYAAPTPTESYNDYLDEKIKFLEEIISNNKLELSRFQTLSKSKYISGRINKFVKYLNFQTYIVPIYNKFLDAKKKFKDKLGGLDVESDIGDVLKGRECYINLLKKSSEELTKDIKYLQNMHEELNIGKNDNILFIKSGKKREQYEASKESMKTEDIAKYYKDMVFNILGNK